VQHVEFVEYQNLVLVLGRQGQGLLVTGLQGL